VTVTPEASFFVLLTLRLASIRALKFESIKKRENSKTGGVIGLATIIEGKIMNLSARGPISVNKDVNLLLWTDVQRDQLGFHRWSLRPHAFVIRCRPNENSTQLLGLSREMPNFWV
jgi:hypothetical protein